MLEREWVSISDPEDARERYLFDVSFLLSSYTCIYGRGCRGIAGDPTKGCCSLGAHYVDEGDRARVEALVTELGPERMQHHAEARRRGASASLPGGEHRTRVKDGACIFLNRQGWPAGEGCALHLLALERGEHPLHYKPEVCWIVPLRREVAAGVGDDGEECWTTTITSYDRGAWGAGGADFSWWCTDSPEAYVGAEPVYRSMEAELRALTSDSVYEELARYLDGRRTAARRPLPFPVFVK